MICIKLRSLFGVLCAAAFVAQAAFAQQPQRLDAITLNAGMHNIRAEVAMTPGQRTLGLMYRRDLASHEGMLFVHPYAGVQCFHMGNTPLPLSIAFLRDDGSVVNILDMTPYSSELYCSAEPVRYALEMNQGWFAKRGVKPGFRLKGAPFEPGAAR
jgi:uncharacterized membrane protein (UPF0127 family)